MSASNALNAPLATVDPEIAALIAKEAARQEHEIELIASENSVSKALTFTI
jgi:glycine hydroxymethyltransferase